MKLEFSPQSVSEELFNELDIAGYLSLFDVRMPILPQVTLDLLDKQSGTAHFERLRILEKQILSTHTDLKSLITKSSRLPFLDYLLPFFKGRSLESYHLYDLGRFILNDHELRECEKDLPAFKADQDNETIKNILSRYTTNRFSGMRLSREQKKLKQDIAHFDQAILDAVSLYEKQIYQDTGLDMIHPYPKEVLPDDSRLAAVRSCGLLNVTDKGDTLRVDYRLPDNITAMILNKKRQDDAFTTSVSAALKALNEALNPFYTGFRKYYEERKKRVYAYVLLWTKKRYGLSFPEFSGSNACYLKKGILPVLKAQQPDKYVPLTLDLENGVSVLFGANMTGKTTVLKTLYFHLTTVKAGLPVPAAVFRLSFPDEIALHLKSSGSLQSGLSGFGEEVLFFCRTFSRNAYILVDELFQSTDPVTGAILSEIILREFHPQELIFFCSSHYPDILKVKGPVFLRMKDFPRNLKKKMDFRKLQSYIPYEIEKLPADQKAVVENELRTSLAVALMFPLPDSLKKRISKKLGIKGDHGPDST